MEQFEDARNWEDKKNEMEGRFIEAGKWARSLEDEASRLKRECDRVRRGRLASERSQRALKDQEEVDEECRLRTKAERI